MPKLQRDEALHRMHHASVARLATADADGVPHLVPIVFALSDDRTTLVSAVDHKPKRTVALKRLANIAAQARVSVLADHYDDDWSQLWWVRIDGEAVVHPTPPADTLEQLAAKYPQYREHPPSAAVIAVTIDSVTGWTSIS